MGTNCDENAAAPVAAKNNSRMTETTVSPGGQEYLSVSSLQTHYPLVGAAVARIQLPIGQARAPRGNVLLVSVPVISRPFVPMERTN